MSMVSSAATAISESDKVVDTAARLISNVLLVALLTVDKGSSMRLLILGLEDTRP